MDRAVVVQRYGPPLLPLLQHLSHIQYRSLKSVIYAYREGREGIVVGEIILSWAETEEGYQASPQVQAQEGI